MKNDLRKNHLINFKKLSAAERLDWALRTGWEMFNALPKSKQETFLKMRSHERSQRNT